MIRAPIAFYSRLLPTPASNMAMNVPRACRTPAHQEEQAAKRMENPAMSGPVENTAKRAAALAEKFEGVRKKS